MHVALLVDLDPDPLDEPPVDALDSLAGLLAGRSRPPVAVHVAAHLLEAAEERPDLVERLAELDVEWVRTGWGSPDPWLVPDRVMALALSRETAILERLGLEPGAFWARDRWERRLPLVLDDAGVPRVLVDQTAASEGVVVHLDRVLPAWGVTPLPDPVAEPGTDDGLVVWHTAPTRLADAVRAIRSLPGCDLTTPGRYAADHPVSGRLAVKTAAPSLDADGELLHRKLVRLATRLPERPPGRAVTALLAAAGHHRYRPGADPEHLAVAHAALVRARVAIDQARRRGDDWGRITRLDWDADGGLDLHLEQPGLSLVVDPADGGRVLSLDDKHRERVLGTVPGEEPGALCRWQETRDGPAVLPRLELLREEESREELRVWLSGSLGEGTVELELVVADGRLQLDYGLSRPVGGRLGPELLLSLPEHRLRVDGSEWRTVDEPADVSGHRFRLGGDDRQVLISSMIPIDLAVEPAGPGLRVRPHWPATGESTHQLVVEIT